MRIVINTTSLLGPLSGIGVYTLNLAKEFLRQRPDITYIYFRGYFTKNLLPPHSLIRVIRELPLRSLRSLLRNLVFHLSRSFKTFDLYFEPNFIPLKIKAKRVIVTVHDLSIFHFPEWHPKERVEYVRKNILRALKDSDVLVVPSKFVEKEIREIFGEDLNIVSIPNGFDPEIYFPEAEKEGSYILSVGTLEPRKNIKNLILAYRSLPENIRKEYPLYICGAYGWGDQDLFSLISSENKSQIRYLGYVESERLAKLYRGAICLVYPSFYEGFGLPPLEAMASGCPAVVSSRSSLPEVCGDAAYYVDPYDVESISYGIRRIIEDSHLRSSLRSKGIQRARDFTWEKSARRYLELFENLLSGDG